VAKKSGVPGSMRAEIMRRDGYRCRNCGVAGWEHRGPQHIAYPTAIHSVFLSVDHIVPRSRGGAHADPTNLRVLCTRCNSKKGTSIVAPGGRD
jgi:5-methylcytosine-specific restriction endonuclease McrA